MLGTVLSLLYILMCLIPVRALGDRYYCCLQFINEETAAKREIKELV